MTTERETYTELLHALIWAYAQGNLKLPQVAAILYSCAQPNTVEEVADITPKVRGALSDWSEQDRGMLIAVETVQITFQCTNIHDGCEKGQHTVTMTRVIGSMNWQPEHVVSMHNFQQVIMDETIKQHPDGPEGRFVASQHQAGARPSDLISAFQRIFDQAAPVIDQKVKDFRAELDELFPSIPTTPEKGGSDGSP